MSGKLDQSLDDILKTRRNTKTARGRAARSSRGGARTGERKAAPVSGGITKNTKVAKTGGRVVAAAPVVTSSKILVTGLPHDVTESQIKEYFQQVVAPVKSVFLTYGSNGASRGIATITFFQANSAAIAASKFDGTKVDGKPIKIEVIVSAKQAPAPKALSERVAQPKTAVAKKQGAKPVAAAKGAAKTGRGGAKKGAKPARRGKPKTADELDAEMTDYFVPKENAAPAANGAAGGDASMDDQIM